MTTLQMIDSIHQVFPNVSRNQIRLDLDSAQKLLASETGTITTRASLSAPTTNFAWELPAGFIRLLDFVMYDADNEPIYKDDENYNHQIEFDKFFVYSTGSTPITGLDCTSAYIHYEGLPATLSNETVALEIEQHYRDAIEHYVLSKYFAKFPIPFVSNGQLVQALNLNASNLHDSRYEKLRIKLKREFKSRETTDNHYMNYNYPGRFYLPRRPNDDTTGSTISLNALSELYTKYAYVKVTSGTDGEVSPILNTYSTLSVSISGDVVTLASTAEFDEEGIIIPNNWDAYWTRNSSSEIVITLPSGWSTFSFEIYERD